MKSLGQLAHEIFAAKYLTPSWSSMQREYQQFWEDLAKAVVEESKKRVKLTGESK
jgi:hypothetical protein